jgi:hypothetical protein
LRVLITIGTDGLAMSVRLRDRAWLVDVIAVLRS